jgi:hypothetical protein
VDPIAGLDDVEKSKFFTLPGLELQPLGRPAPRQSIYRLSYPGSTKGVVINNTNRTSERGGVREKLFFCCGDEGWRLKIKKKLFCVKF